MDLCKIAIVASIGLMSPNLLAKKVDIGKSSVEWLGSKAIGSTHNGTVELKSADLKVDGGLITGGTFVVDMSTIANTDLKDRDFNKKLVGHLKSSDFFDTKNYPTATLEIKSARNLGKDRYDVEGTLEIKGVKHAVGFTVKALEKLEDETSKTLQAKVNFNRTKFGIKYGSGSFFDNLGDKVISDNVTLTVKLNIRKGDGFASK